MSQHTPGPWQWFVRTTGEIHLATPHSGYLIVMDFVRQGMRGAQPRFATWDGAERGKMGGIMRKGEELDVAKHPDALLIASAPDLLEAFERLVGHIEQGKRIAPEDMIAVRAFLAKAKGGAP